MARSIVRRAAYAALFVIVLPILLVLWSRAAAHNVPLPVLHSPGFGITLAALGLSLLISGAYALMRHGRGVPLNPFPPERLVRSGVYRFLSNPMYIGFGACCWGLAIATGSASGLWLVAPVASAAAAALVFGFERHDLHRRFGEIALAPPLLSLPHANGERPTGWERAAVYAWVLAPWLGIYGAVQLLGVPEDAFASLLPFERDWPVIEPTELFYASVYLFIPLTPLLVRTRADVRRFAVMGAIATFVVALMWLTIPVVATHRPFVPGTWLGRLLAYERATSLGVAAFPAFHLLWALIAADAWQGNARHTGHRAWAMVGWTWAGLIGVSCITTGMHALVDLAAACLLFLPLRRYPAVWQGVRGATERVANSWKEWRAGAVRVINHGGWAGAAAGVGLLVSGWAAGPGHHMQVAAIGASILLGAGIWGQLVEGSSKLLRPFGWYGGVFGGLIAVAIIGVRGGPMMLLAGAFAVAAPWIQMIGRLRCLVQGCCHGAPAPAGVGIRYRHPRSRVTQLAGLADTPIHATPLYSIAANLVTAVLLLRFWILGASPALVFGVWLILNGLARFVEEAYRGEPQTPIVAGLRLYQWLAVLSVVAGAAVTTLSAPPPSGPHGPPGAGLVLVAAALALLTGVAMGVDFPGSNQRFSRLAPADPS